MNEPSNWRATAPLREYLRRHGIPAIAGLDTRALTTLLREKGTQKAYMAVEGRTAAPGSVALHGGCGSQPTAQTDGGRDSVEPVSEAEAVERARAWEGLDGQDYAARVSCEAPYRWDETDALTRSWGIASELPPADLNVVAYDFGIKWNILRGRRRSGMAVTVVPAKTPAADVLAMKPDGVFLSNGPADPAAVTYAIDNARGLLGKVPLMGICLGHQILGLAVGGKTFKLKFGHHGCNHPVMDLRTGKVEITSQNHNFSVDPDTLDSAVAEVTHRNLNDGTVEGFEHRSAPMFCVQYHPEAGPGPHDPFYLFARFRDLIRRA
jgi:carbamoyl-phosphate synthase small subunit